MHNTSQRWGWTRDEKSTTVESSVRLTGHGVQFTTLFQGFQERGEGDLQCSGNIQQGPQRDIPLTPFNRTDIGGGQTHACGERALGKSLLLPEGANDAAQKLESLIWASSLCNHGMPVAKSTEPKTVP